MCNPGLHHYLSWFSLDQVFWDWFTLVQSWFNSSRSSGHWFSLILIIGSLCGASLSIMVLDTTVHAAPGPLLLPDARLLYLLLLHATLILDRLQRGYAAIIVIFGAMLFGVADKRNEHTVLNDSLLVLLPVLPLLSMLWLHSFCQRSFRYSISFRALDVTP